MNAEQKLRVEELTDELARILYEEADKSQIQTLAGIEECVRAQALAHILPRVGAFFCGGSRRQGAKPVPLPEERFRRIEADLQAGAKARSQAARRPKPAAGTAGVAHCGQRIL